MGYCQNRAFVSSWVALRVLLLDGTHPVSAQAATLQLRGGVSMPHGSYLSFFGHDREGRSHRSASCKAAARSCLSDSVPMSASTQHVAILLSMQDRGCLDAGFSRHGMPYESGHHGAIASLSDEQLAELARHRNLRTNVLLLAHLTRLLALSISGRGVNLGRANVLNVSICEKLRGRPSLSNVAEALQMGVRHRAAESAVASSATKCSKVRHLQAWKQGIAWKT